jgi:hypothetical protein
VIIVCTCMYTKCEEITACSTENDRAVNKEEEGKHNVRQKERMQRRISFHIKHTRNKNELSYETDSCFI